MTDKAQALKEAFMKQFSNDPDIAKLPLPDSVRDKLGIYQSLDYIPVQKAITKCLFNGERYSEMVEIKPDPTKEFPDLAKLADEYRKTYMVEDTKPETIVEEDKETKGDE